MKIQLEEILITLSLWLKIGTDEVNSLRFPFQIMFLLYKKSRLISLMNPLLILRNLDYL